MNKLEHNCKFSYKLAYLDVNKSLGNEMFKIKYV